MSHSIIAAFASDRIKYAVAGTVSYPPGGQFGPRTQPDIQLVFVHSGSMEVSIDGVTHHVMPGSAMLLLPGAVEVFQFSRDQETWHRWISIHIGELRAEEEEWLRSLSNKAPIPVEMNTLIDLMLQLSSEHMPDSGAMCNLGMSALHVYVSAASHSTRASTHSSVSAAIAFMEAHFADDLTLEEIARHAGVTSEYLVRLFRKHLHTTPFQYLWKYRLQKGVEWLTHTGLSVSEIALRCGFKTSYHFARKMKDQTGSTPSDIRKSAWGE